MKILGWAADRQGPGYYRLGLPLQQMRRQYDDMDTLVDTTILLKDAQDCDIIVAQRTAKVSSSLWFQGNAIDGRCMVYELDDDLWELHPTNPGYREWATPERQKILTRNVQCATAVTVSTAHLAEVVAKINPNVYLLPNCVDEALLEVQHPRREKLTIGWAGSATHFIDFKVAARQLAKYFQRYPDSDMHFMGSSYHNLIRKTSRVTGWSTDMAAYHRSIDFDIGLAPLANIGFNRSKSPIKAQEYAALGIPVIASDVGPYRDFVDHGVTGFLVRRDDEWFRYLRILTEDADLREAMGSAARAQAAQWTIQRNAYWWAAAYEDILHGRPAHVADPYFDLPADAQADLCVS